MRPPGRRGEAREWRAARRASGVPAEENQSPAPPRRFERVLVPLAASTPRPRGAGRPARTRRRRRGTAGRPVRRGREPRAPVRPAVRTRGGEPRPRPERRVAARGGRARLSRGGRAPCRGCSPARRSARGRMLVPRDPRPVAGRSRRPGSRSHDPRRVDAAGHRRARTRVRRPVAVLFDASAAALRGLAAATRLARSHRPRAPDSRAARRGRGAFRRERRGRGMAGRGAARRQATLALPPTAAALFAAVRTHRRRDAGRCRCRRWRRSPWTWRRSPPTRPAR